ncbi:MAG TPA: YbaB/EbfC family DNA-binding protein [Herbaspirillum sp.]
MLDSVRNNTFSAGALRRSWRGLLRLLGSVGLGLAVSSSPVSAQTAQPPQNWISYAQLASNQFEGWLSDPENDTVQRLHAWMQQRMLQDGQPLSPSLVTRVWIAGDGHVGRVEFPTLGNAQADADLRTLLTEQPLSEPPPPDMRQPMILQLTLSFVDQP